MKSKTKFHLGNNNYMILILDACTISNLVNVFQDDSMLIEIKKCFKEVYITPEVINEVTNNKSEFLDFYKNRWDEVDELYNKLSLNTCISSEDKNKGDCIGFITKFAIQKKLSYNNTDGEYFSSLLALYISRLGQTVLGENIRAIIFVTDDARAEEAYEHFFSNNQIGSIIDSIDLVIMLYLKDRITKKRVIMYIEGLFTIYNKELNKLRYALNGVDIKDKANSKQRLLTEELRQLLYDGNIPSLLQAIGESKFRDYFVANRGIKKLIEGININTYQNKIPYLHSKKKEIVHDLVWAG